MLRCFCNTATASGYVLFIQLCCQIAAIVTHGFGTTDRELSRGDPSLTPRPD